MDYEQLFGDLFDDLDRSSDMPDCNDGFVNDVYALLLTYSEQRGKGETFQESRRMDE